MGAGVGLGVDGKSKEIGTVGDPPELRVTDLSDRELQEAQLVELRLISLKLNCLQPDNEQFDESDLDSLEQ